MLMAEPTKAYRVLERFEGYKVVLVFAHTVSEAKELVREGQASEVLGDQLHPAGISECRREPLEDR